MPHKPLCHKDSPESRAPLQLVDCTLREGDQSAGVWLSEGDKLRLFAALDSAGVDIIDGGMPAVGEGERRLLKAIADAPRRARVAASVRVRPEEIDLAAACGVDAAFLIFPVSDLHLQRLGLNRDAWAHLGDDALKRCHHKDMAPYLVLEDASRATPEALAAALAIAREGGAALVMLCDTVGVLTPSRAAALVAEARRAGGDQLPLGTHFHNDFGMATANTLAAIEAGATHPSVTLNGLGERAGNAPLAEVVMAARLLLGIECALSPESLPALSALAEALSGIPLGPQAPIVGPRAFLHESGIHVDGVLKDPRTYEAIDPATLGLTRRIVFGKHTGRAALKSFALAHRLPADEPTLGAVLQAIKARGGDPTRGEIIARWRQDTRAPGIPEAELRGLFEAVSEAQP